MSKSTRRVKIGNSKLSKIQQNSNTPKTSQRDQRLENEVNGLFKGLSSSPWPAMRINGLREGGLRQVGLKIDLDNEEKN